MKKIKLIAVLTLITLLFSSAYVFAVSRHTKDTAVTRYTVTIAEGQSLTKIVSCYDPDGDAVTITPDSLPTGAVLGPLVAQTVYTDPDLPAANPEAKWYTRELTWTPTFNQAGTYTFWFNAKDPTGDEDWCKYVVTVTNANRPPVL